MRIREPISPIHNGGGQFGRPWLLSAGTLPRKPHFILLNCIKGGIGGGFVFGSHYYGTPHMRGDGVQSFLVCTDMATGDTEVVAASLFEPLNPANWYLWPTLLRPTVITARYDPNVAFAA